MRRCSFLSLVLALVVQARSASTTPEIGWVGLFSDSLIGWLDNKNPIEALCPSRVMAADAPQACRAQKLQPASGDRDAANDPRSLVEPCRIAHGDRRTGTGPTGHLLLVPAHMKGC